jgi:exodeoxyribonuclease V alpha subunit
MVSARPICFSTFFRSRNSLKRRVVAVLRSVQALRAAKSLNSVSSSLSKPSPLDTGDTGDTETQDTQGDSGRLTAIQKHIAEALLDKVGELDGITFFDKVIQIRNRPKSDMASAYNVKTRKIDKIELFNGELGFVKPHGFDANKWRWQKDFWLQHFQVVFSRKRDHWVNYGSKLGKYDTNRWIPRQPVEENLELAYAISVHKAQGSEFERTYVIVPKSKTALLSPELFYTAVTRATRHCTLMVEQDVSVLINIRRREKSHLLQINSSLFEFRPVPEPLLHLGSWYEEGKIHEALVGCMVRSKSEVIIANLLTTAGIPFRYEVPLFAPDGTFYLPDFTIDWAGKSFFGSIWGCCGTQNTKKPGKRRKNGMRNISKMCCLSPKSRRS